MTNEGIRAGKQQKGGVGTMPTTPRPISPKGQGRTKMIETQGIIIRPNSAGNHTVSTEDGTNVVNCCNAFAAAHKAATMLLSSETKESIQSAAKTQNT